MVRFTSICVIVGACGRIGYDIESLPGTSPSSGGPLGGSSGATLTTEGSPTGGVAGSVGAGGIADVTSAGSGGIGVGTTSGTGGAVTTTGTSGSGGAPTTSATSGASGSATAGGGGAAGSGSSGTGGLDGGRGPDSGGTPPAGPRYEIIGTQSAKCLDVPLSSTTDGTELVINPCTGGSNQLFTLLDLGGGETQLVNVNSAKCLDLPGATNGIRLSQRACGAVTTQAFKVQSLTSTTIVSVPSGLCVEVLGAVSADGSPLDGWGCSGGTNQSWKLQAITGTCAPESDRAFCTRLGFQCDRATGQDNCGATRTVVCGPCVALSQACGLVAPNTCSAIGKTNLARGGVVTASNAGTAPTDMTAAFDENSTTQWFASGTPTGWIAYQFAANARNVVTSYSVTSSPDWPDTDPKDWTLDGSNGNNIWVTLDRRTSQAFVSRGQTNFYTFSNTTGYNHYRLNVTAGNGSTQNLHLAEIELFR